MKTINEMINELTVLRDKLGGNVQVFFDKNGADDGARSITDIDEVGYFYNSEDGEFCWVSDWDPGEHKVHKMVRIYSNRASLYDNLENKQWPE